MEDAPSTTLKVHTIYHNHEGRGASRFREAHAIHRPKGREERKKVGGGEKVWQARQDSYPHYVQKVSDVMFLGGNLRTFAEDLLGEPFQVLALEQRHQQLSKKLKVAGAANQVILGCQNSRKRRQVETSEHHNWELNTQKRYPLPNAKW
jgi:hypothetical protein